jgi:hypothetical protein
MTFRYAIVNTKTGEYWSNDIGWVEQGFDFFNTDDLTLLNLPLEGAWEQVDE